ncbi:MAG: ATP synthase F1 subunit delta [Phycisphaerales bacterium]|jgi:ATP synthase F1 delta subunit|nr:ATP synthase F1 subunit delta [Phycisphaerales bacterium]
MPLIESKPDAVAITYARALFDVVRGGGAGAVEETRQELHDVVELARRDKAFGEFLSSRIVDSGKRERSLDKMFGGRVSGSVLNFLKVLNSNGRLGSLPAIAEAFTTVAQESFGQIPVLVTTATPMSEGEHAALASRLKAQLGREPVLNCTVNPALIGGVRIQIGDKLIDASVATRLAQVRDSMNSRGSALVRAAAEKIFTGV